MSFKLMYISDYLYTVGGSHENSVMHLECLQRAIGEENVVCVALTAGQEIKKDDGYLHLQAYKNRLGQLRNLVFLNDYCINARVTKSICEEIRKRKVDCIFLNCTMGKLAATIKKYFPQIIVISFYHDIKALLLQEWVKEKGIKAIPLSISGRYNEKQMQKVADLHVTLNKRDSNMFRQVYGKESNYELPIVLNDKFDAEKMKCNYPEMNILFAGVYYYPNVQGVKWFCKNVMPLIKEPVHLNIVGLNMERLKGEIEDPRVTVIGTVDSVAEWYEKSDLVIAPIFKGGGMKIKTAEAFMYGKLYIGTDESMEGYSEIIPKELSGQTVFQCNTPNDYVEAISKAYVSLSSQKMGYNKEIRQLFENYFSVEAGTRRMTELIEIAKGLLNGSNESFTNSIKY